jgi:hypothetical protein
MACDADVRTAVDFMAKWVVQAASSTGGRDGMPAVKYRQRSQRQVPMTTSQFFSHAAFLHELETSGATACAAAYAPLPAALLHVLMAADDAGKPAPPVASLIHLLKARAAVLQAAFGIEVVADELRRYQKFARPGQPSPHIVQLRQQQAAARREASRARQAFVAAAAAFVREAHIEVPPRMALEAFVTGWIETHVPKAAFPPRLEPG